MAKKKKRKNSYMMPVLITFLVLSVVTGIIVVIGMFSGNNNKKKYAAADGSSDVIRETDTHTDAGQEWSVSINLFDCTMYIGTVLDVTATVKPEGGNVSWFSSNPEALLIDQTGKAVVVGKGITTITASMGSLSDTVIVECVSEEGRSALGFPVYTVAQVPTAPADVGEESQAFPVAAGNTTTAAQNVTKPSQQEGVRPTQGSQGTTQTVPPPTQAPTKPLNQTGAQTPTAYTQPAVKPVSDIDSTQIGPYLTQYGFSVHSDGTYVYEKDKICYGEVVLDSEKTHLYLIQDQDSFNLAAVSIIAELLPESYENVWKTAQKAQSDMAMTVDGRTVRIVVPQSGGHKQIVIFN